jgi:hypothetical protein
MDELTLMRSFRAERVRPKSAARALAWRALETRIEAESTSTSLAGGGAIAGGRTARDHAPRRRPALGRRLSAQRRRLVAFAAATALAAVLAGVLVFSSGPTAQPAGAAEILRRTATIAAAESGPGLFPGPHQLIFEKTEHLELQEWAPGEWTASYGGVIPAKPTTTYAGYVRFTEEAWMSNKRTGRLRVKLGNVSFLSTAERQRWKAAGSPLPGSFSGEESAAPEEHVLQIGRGLRDVEVLDGPGYGQFADLPTEPEALRRTLERKQANADKGKVDNGRVIVELWGILEKANTSPALRAAVFNALAEEPGIRLDRTAKDLVGRSGYALSYASKKASLYGQGGIRTEYIFDPETSAILGRREILADPSLRPWVKGIPAGTVLRDVAYLGSGIVDSPHERPS